MTAKELKPTAVAHGPSLATYHVCTKVPQIPLNPTQNQCDHNPAAVRPRLSSFSVWRLRQSHVPSWRISKHEKGYVTWWKRDENVWWTTKTPAVFAKYSDCYRCLRKVIWTRNFVLSIHIFNRSGKVVERCLSGCRHDICAFLHSTDFRAYLIREKNIFWLLV